MAKKKASGDQTRAGDTAAAPYVVLARKYRPATFDDLIGQSAMVRTLRNAFQTGRIAQGYMLTGVRGVGKTTTARILARALNYETAEINRPTIDMPVPGVHCRDIMEGRHPDVFEMDAASNTGIDNIREIIESAQYTPLVARNKVFIIDEVHMLSKGAFNALLKTLEEPPAHVRFIFATTEIRKVPVTVLSRCQRFDLRRVEQPVLVDHFEKIVESEGANAERDALALIARAAEGSVRDGLSILDQAIAMGEGKVRIGNVRAMLGLADRSRIFDLAESLFRGNMPDVLAKFQALHGDGAEASQIISDLADAVHVVARIKAVGPEPAGEALSVEETARAKSFADALSMAYLSRAWQMLSKGLEDIARAATPTAAAEMVLIRLAYTADLPTPDELIRTLGGETIARRGASPSSDDGSGPDTNRVLNMAPPMAPTDAALASVPPVNTVTAVLPSEDREDVSALAPEIIDDGADEPFEDGRDVEPMFDDGEEVSSGDDQPRAEQPAFRPSDPRSFLEVVSLAGLKRDARLKLHLEDNVSLVKFDAAGAAIDLFLLPGAPPELANELREKLNQWTGRRWIVMLSRAEGQRAVGAVRREREAAEQAALEQHPDVRAVFAAFPDAKITDIRVTGATKKKRDAGTRDDESQAG